MTDPIGPIRSALAGRYEIEREIGKGAFARVYLARDLRHDRLVAFKVSLDDQRFLMIRRCRQAGPTS
jgi:serine/threonine protein kinase